MFGDERLCRGIIWTPSPSATGTARIADSSEGRRGHHQDEVVGQRKAKCPNRHHQRDDDDERLSPETVAEHTNANGEQGAGDA
jgi:hypothetical protein